LIETLLPSPLAPSAESVRLPRFKRSVFREGRDQSAKTSEAGGPRGYDAGKKVKGRKRHLLTDTNGLPVAAPFSRPTSRIATAPPSSWPPPAISIHGCGMSLPTRRHW
jgi:hypothetical protein